MSILSKLKSIFASPAGKAVEQFAANEFDRAVAAAKQTAIGKAAVDAIHAAEASGGTGADKMARVIAAISPAILTYAVNGGFSGATADVEQFARAVAESTLADIKATPAAAVARAILSWLGIKL